MGCESKGGDALVWQPAGRPIRVLIRPRAAERMRREALRRAGSGDESGGLLRGTIVRNGPLTVTVEEIEPMAWSFSMSAKDRRELDAALKGKPGSQPRWAVVGYYRTHSREDLFLNAGDIALIRVCFPDPGNVFLLLKPGPDKSLVSRLCFWQGSAMQSEEGDPEFPFGRPADEPARGSAPLPGYGTPALPALSWRPRLEVPRIPEGARKALWGMAAAAALAAVLVLAPWKPSAPVVRTERAPAAAEDRGLALSVEKAGNSLVVRWNGESTAVCAAAGGVLLVQDGAHRRVYELTSRDLRSGSIFYLPSAGDLQLRLEVRGQDGEQTVESARVLSAGLPAVPAAVPPVEQAAMPAQFDAPPPPAGYGSADRRAPRAAVRPARAAREEVVREEREGEEEPALRARTVHFQYRDERAPEGGASESRPRPVVQVDPEFPRDVRTALRGSVELGVRVFVDHTGKVTRAQVVSRKGPASSLLADSAVSAAKLWRFEPAVRGGRPVPSDTVVSFHFAR